MKKNTKKEDNDTLAYIAFIILLLGLVIGTLFIITGINCKTINEISSCILGAFIMLIFFIISFIMYLVARKDELKKLFDDTNE